MPLTVTLSPLLEIATGPVQRISGPVCVVGAAWAVPAPDTSIVPAASIATTRVKVVSW
jgi:hypothetical protein